MWVAICFEKNFTKFRPNSCAFLKGGKILKRRDNEIFLRHTQKGTHMRSAW